MKNNLTIGLLLCFITILGYSQTDKSIFGIKGGINFSKFNPGNEEDDFGFKPGFYIGTFLNMNINEGGNMSFQPELIFALQGSQVTSEIEIRDSNGNPLPNSQPYDITYNYNEFSLLLPIMLKLQLGGGFYLESGPQLNFILGNSITSNQTLLDGTGEELDSIDYGSFDFGFNVGIGYDLTENLNINLRGVSSLVKRKNDVKEINFNAGLEYIF